MATRTLCEDELALLREEVEMLMAERRQLLKVAGAAAAFVAELDSSTLAEGTLDAADLLASNLNRLSEESLSEALASVHAYMVLPMIGRGLHATN